MYQFLGLLDIDGTVLEINQSALDGAGLCLQDVLGKPFWLARWWEVSDEIRQHVKTMIQQSSRGQFVRCDFEVFGASQGDQTIVIDFSLKPIFDDAGQVAFLLPEGRNITEKIASNAELSRKNSELQNALEKLKELDGYKTHFFANVSHELRTPLTLILGAVEQLTQESKALKEREQFRLAAIQRNANALYQQVNNLLDLARVDAKRMPLAYTHTHVMSMLREITSGFAAAAQDRQIQFQVYGDETLGMAVDRAKFARILSNLLANAFKFTPRGGRIRCSVEMLANARLLLSVQDNGIGIADNMKPHIFERFTQGSEELGAGGSGLGLNIVKEFVDLHGGTVIVLDAPNGGAIFQVELPLNAPEGVFVRTDYAPPTSVSTPTFTTPIIEAPYPSAQPAPLHKPRILIAEDNLDLRFFLYETLVDEYHVILTENGQTAFQTALANPPDLLITDLMMPQWDGERLVRALRNQASLPKIPVLALSARSDEVLKEKLLKDLVQDYLTKPFSAQELRARVRNLVTVKRSVDLLQKELNSQTSNILELTADLVEHRQSLQNSLNALQVAERRWSGLYENTAVGIALADGEGKILSANPALQRMLGYDATEILGLSFIEITEATLRPQTRTNVSELYDGKYPNYHLQKRYTKKNGDYLWANVCVSRIPANDADTPLLAVIIQDISLRMQAERSLETTRNELTRVARFTAMGELVASIAHEINQPLSAVITNSDAALRWLTRPTPDLAEVQAALKRVNRDANLASAVIARIRKFLRTGELKREQIQIQTLLQELLQMLQSTLSEAEVSVQIEPLPTPLYLMADPVQLQQVLVNLIMNGIDAMRELAKSERLLRIKVQQIETNSLQFTIEDNGSGIKQGTAGKLFDAFFSTKQNGLGMGLAISRSIVENHGGRLWCDTARQTGACFIFTIPNE
jgi:PAS domain S-box-containing protein